MCVRISLFVIYVRSFFCCIELHQVPYGLAVRIPGFHSGGPGSTPGMGMICFVFSSNMKRIFRTQCLQKM